jgi:hypothetical protein
MGEREGIAGGHQGDQALTGVVWGVLGAAAVVLLPAAAFAAPPAYCNGQTITTDSGVHYYPNGGRVVDGFGKPYYPNGTRVVNDYGDEIRYSNGARVRNMAGDLLFPNGTAVKSSFGDVRYPSGRATRDAGGRCYYETGVEMTPCQRLVSIREFLAGGETADYELDIVAGTIDLSNVRFEFPSGGVITVLSANLAAGEIDGQSIAATCTSGAAPRR